MIQKTLAIYFSEKNPQGYPFDTAWYFASYADLIARVESAGFVVVIVRADAYLGAALWSSYSKIIDGEVQFFDEEVRSDVIFNRDANNTIPRIDDCVVINHPDFDELCIDKYKTAKAFPELSPKTAYIHSFAQLQNTLESWQLKEKQNIVLKKNYLHSGLGITIEPWEKLTEDFYDDWTDILVQSFEDSTNGIPGLVDGPHDLRIYVVDGQAVNAMIRTPKPGTLIASVEMGGASKTVPLSAIDQTVFNQVASIEPKLKQYGRTLYAADFLKNTDGKYILVELNSRPGVPNPAWEEYEVVQSAFAKLLIDSLQSVN